jgi:DNA-binding protein Fis
VSLREVETEHITRVMKQASTMTEAAKILGITRDTLHRKKKEMSRDPDVQEG